MGRTYEEASRSEWRRRDDTDPNHAEEIRTGCLQRIAKATETMSARYTDLLDQVRRERDRRGQVELELASAHRRTAALRGIIARLKRKGGRL